MTTQLPSSGVLRMSDIKRNLEITSNANLSMGDPLLRALSDKRTGQIKLADFYSANEVECLIKAANDDNGNARGFYLSFWGENDRPNLANQILIGAYDAFDSNPDKFVLALQGNQPRNTFRAIVINNVIYYEADASSWTYMPGPNTTVWEWSGFPAGLQVGVIYELSMLVGPGATVTPTGTFPVGQGTDWTLSFEEVFDGPALDTTKWNTQLWYEAVNTAANYDIFSGRLRMWPLQVGGVWKERNLTTFGKFSQVNGYWEIKCRTPKNKGIRTTFWLLNHDTTARPIISAFRCFPGTPPANGWVDADGDIVNFSFGVQPTTDGVWLMDKKYSDLLPARPAIDLDSAEHVFGIKKTSTRVEFYLDGTLLEGVDLLGPNTMTLAQYMVVTLDYVGNTPDGTTIQNSSAAFEVDYIRAWTAGGVSQPGSGGGGTTPANSAYIAPYGMPSASFPYMTFREEFTGAVLDTSKWVNHIWTEPDNLKNNIAVANGTLYMWPELPFPNTSSVPNTNATITTDGTFYQKYGYFEVRAKMPIGRGCWSSFWLYNHDLSSIRPEITVFETFSGADASVNKDWATTTLHPQRFASSVWSESVGQLLGTRNSANTFGYVDLTLDWHIFGIEWRRDFIQFRCDGIPLGAQIPIPAGDMDMRMYLTLSLWLGSESGQANTTETPTGQSNSFMVDYVRGWALDDGTTIVEGTLPPLPPEQGGKQTGTTTPVTKDIIAFVGNSTTWGYKTLTGGQVITPYPAAFAQRQTAYDVRNHGISSTNTTHWVNGTNGVPQTFAAFMAANTNFKYVCLDFGTIDQFDMTTTTFKNNLKAMITEIRKVSTRKPILITPFVADFSGLAAYAQAVRDVGAEVQVAVIDKYTWAQSFITTNGGDVRTFVPDGIHPTEQMYIDGGAYVSSQWSAAIAAPIGTNPDNIFTVNLSTYGGGPAKTLAENVDAFDAAIAALNAQGGGRLIFDAGTYNCGNQTANAILFFIGGMNNIILSGYGATILMNTTDGSETRCFYLTTPNNSMVEGFTFNDTGANFTGGSANNGATCIYTPIFSACSNFRVKNCTVLRSNIFVWFDDSTAPTRFTNTHVTGCTVNNSYYGWNGNCGYGSSAASKSTVELTCRNVRRAVIGAALSRMNITITAIGQAGQSASNGFISPIARSGRNCEDVDVTLSLSGSWTEFKTFQDSNQGAMVHLGHQNDDGSTLGIKYKNWNVMVIVDNITGTHPSLYCFSSANNSGVYQSATPRLWENMNIECSIVGAYSGLGIKNTTSTSSGVTGSSVIVGSRLSGITNFAPLPTYFTSGGTSIPPPITSDPMPAVPVDHPNTYTLTFNEEFNGSSLNFNLWNDHIWWNEGGEKTGKPVNWQVSNGELHIWPADGFNPRTIDTDFKYYQTQGFFECESKLPIGKGCWPAFWLYNHDGTLRPEVDVMEAYSGGGPSTGWSTSALHPDNYAGTCHQNDGAQIGSVKLRNQPPWDTNTFDLSAGYHKYGALVDGTGVTFYFDGQQVGQKIATTFFTMRMYILLDLYFGSASGIPNDAETPKGISNAFSTRYVRAWRKN